MNLFFFVLLNLYICRSPDRNLGRSGICLGQIGILFWPKVYFRPDKNSYLARQIPDLPRPDGNL